MPILLCSYPKSGNTWVRFILANILAFESDCERVDFHTVHDYIPDLDRDPMALLKRRHIYKTHKPNTLYRRFVSKVLIVRDPVSTLLSYFFYLKNEEKKEIGLNEFLRSPKYGYSAYIKYHESFLLGGNKIFTVEYEKLLHDPSGEVQKISEFIGLGCTKDSIEKAILMSSKSSMRAIEETQGRRYGSQEYSFVGYEPDNKEFIRAEIANFINGYTSKFGS